MIKVNAKQHGEWSPCQEPTVHFQAVSHQDTQNIKILTYLSFLREVVIFTSNGKMIFYQYYVNIVRQTIIWRRGLVLFTYIFVKDFVKEDIKFTSKIASDFRLVFVLLCKDDIWLMSFKTLARYHLWITIKLQKKYSKLASYNSFIIALVSYLLNSTNFFYFLDIKLILRINLRK